MRNYRLLLCLLISLVSLTPCVSHAQGKTAEDGLQWVSWLNSGERMWKGVLRIEPNLKDVIGDGKTVAVAVKDINLDGQNDIILHFWGARDCGADGCLYVVLNNDGTTKRAFVARSFVWTGSGATIDGRYYKL